MSKTKKQAFVIGLPISHSRSPLIHNHWLSVYDIEGIYKKQKVTKNGLEKFVKSVREGKWVGGNVTLPHKEEMLGLVDKCDPTAKRIGAVNTIWKGQNNVLIGGNTDAYGFIANLDEQAKGWDSQANRRQPAIVLGAGGAARAIVDALVQKKFQKVVIANRTHNRAENLAKHFGQKRCQAVTLSDVNKFISKARVIVNTIPPQNKLTKIKLSGANRKCLVADIVYHPLQTPILKKAKEYNLKTVDGLGMLIHQATPGFKKWFGVSPEVTQELREIMLIDLGEKPKPKKTIFVGVTGSIAMGKTTVANMFKKSGIPVCDSDQIVHKLYEGPAVPIIQKMFGGGVIKNNKVNRKALAKIVVGDNKKLRQLERAIHPLVKKQEQKFRERVIREKTPIAVFDSPLLMERKDHPKVSEVIVVTAPYKIQRQRAMKRPGMTKQKFEALLEHQMSDKQKQQKANFIIDTSKNIQNVRIEVNKIIEKILNA